MRYKPLKIASTNCGCGHLMSNLWELHPLQEQLLPHYKQSSQTSGNKSYMKGEVNRTLGVRDQKLRYCLRISVLYRAEPKLSLLVQVQAPVITLIQRMKIL